MKSTLACAALLALTALACSDPPKIEPKTPASTASAASVAPKSAATPAQADKRPASGRPAYMKKPNKKVKKPKRLSSLKKAPIQWAEGVGWLSWDEGLKAAKAQNKPICLVLYADWCPRCKDLAPVFTDATIAGLSKDMIMVRQNVDERPAWLEDYRSLGTYVPRIFFFDANGNIQDDLTSSHPRYPYFYTPQGKKALEASMRKALGKS